MAQVYGPHMDEMIEAMLTSRDLNEGKDPLDPGLFPSLGFKNEQRHSYHMQIKNDENTISVTIWRTGQEEFDLSTYLRQSYNGVELWESSGAKVHCEDLLKAQIVIHHIFTSGGKCDATG